MTQDEEIKELEKYFLENQTFHSQQASMAMRIINELCQELNESRLGQAPQLRQ